MNPGSKTEIPSEKSQEQDVSMADIEKPKQEKVNKEQDVIMADIEKFKQEGVSKSQEQDVSMADIEKPKQEKVNKWRSKIMGLHLNSRHLNAEDGDIDTKGDSKPHGGSTLDNEISRNQLLAFTTDDFKIKRYVKTVTDLPLSKYTSIGAIFTNDSLAQKMAENPVAVLKTPKDTLERHHMLGPLPPGKPEMDKVGPTTFLDAAKIEPQPFDKPTSLGTPPIGEDMGDSTQKPHNGVVWPKAWAPRPPYTTPGYNRNGIQQPVGIIQVRRVPSTPSRGNTDSGEHDLPTWVSPLYQSYGIGGPYGPYGPFYEPPNIDNVKAPNRDELPPPPKKCLLMRLWNGLTKRKIVSDDKSLLSFLNLMDEKLVSIRNLIHTTKNDDREMVTAVVDNLSTILKDATEYQQHVLDTADQAVDDDMDLMSVTSAEDLL